MSDLYKELNSFISNQFQYQKNNKMNLHYLHNSKYDGFVPIVFDKKIKINCILNLKNNDILDTINQSNKILKLSKIEAIDSNFDILFYKSNNIIHSIIVLVINECVIKDSIHKYNEQYYQSLNNLNFIDNTQIALKQNIFNYLKSNFQKDFEFPYWIINEDMFKTKTIPYSNYYMENTLLGNNSLYQGKIRLFYSKEEELNADNISIYIEKINQIKSAIELCTDINNELLNTIIEESSTNQNAYKKIFRDTFTISNIIEPSLISSQEELLDKYIYY